MRCLFLTLMLGSLENDSRHKTITLFEFTITQGVRLFFVLHLNIKTHTFTPLEPSDGAAAIKVPGSLVSPTECRRWHRQTEPQTDIATNKLNRPRAGVDSVKRPYIFVLPKYLNYLSCCIFSVRLDEI